MPWRRAWQPTLVLLPENAHGQRSPAGCSPWGHAESGMTKLLSRSHSSENGKERTSENVPRYKNTPKKGKYYHNQNVIIILRVNERLVSTKNQLDKKSDWISERIANVWHCIYPRSTFGPKYEAALKNNRLYSWSLEGAKMGQEVFFFFFFQSFILKQNSLFDCLQFPEDPNQVCRYLT